MKVVVTGATGFVGREVVRALVERGDRVTALTRNTEASRLVLDKIDVVGAELQTLGPWTEALRGADGIVHLAGEPIAGKRWDARQKQIVRDSRVEATRTLVEALAALPPEARPRVLVSASGADYYPFAPDAEFDDDEVTEADSPSESFLGRLCRDWEREALAAESAGLRVACMRTGVVLGRGGAVAKMATPFKLFAGGRIGHGRQWLSWIHRDDVVAAYLAALTDDRYTGALNLVTDSTRNTDLARALGSALGRRAWLPVPAFAVKAAVGELADYLLHGRRVVPKRLRELGFTWRYPELAGALSASV